MKLLHLVLLAAIVMASLVTSEHEIEKRQAPTNIGFTMSAIPLTFLTLMVLRLMATAVRLNRENQEYLKQQQLIQQSPQLQNPGTVRLQFNLLPTTTQRSGYFNPHVKREAPEETLVRPSRAAAATPQVDIDKMLELIRKLDKANCIPLLVCQLYAGDRKSYGVFENSVIKFVEEYDGPSTRQGAAGSVLKAAARLGKSQKSENKCSQAFPSCPISASQMAQVFKSTDSIP